VRSDLPPPAGVSTRVAIPRPCRELRRRRDMRRDLDGVPPDGFASGTVVQPASRGSIPRVVTVHRPRSLPT